MTMDENKRGVTICLFVLYGSLFLGGVFAHTALGVPLLSVPIAYMLTAVAAFSTHVIGHHRVFKRWFRAHTIGHHVHAYPASKFFSDDFEVSLDPNGKFYYPSIFGPGLAALALGYGPLVAFVMCFTSSAAAWVADYLHTGMHLRSFWLNRFALFRELQRLHMFHHAGSCHTNYGVYDFSLDILWGSMRYL